MQPAAIEPSSLPTEDRAGVARVGGAFRVLATRDIRPGEFILELRGIVVDRPSRWSVQVGIGEHLDLPPDVSLVEQLDGHPWRFLNHSCDPNARFSGRVLVATRPIRAWDEVTFDYDTTEFDMAEPFTCACGARCCLGGSAASAICRRAGERSCCPTRPRT